MRVRAALTPYLKRPFSAVDSGTRESTDGFDKAAPPRKRPTGVRRGVFEINGKPTFLFGGDLHYFRVRDRDQDAAKTRAMWADTLDRMKGAGMNLVTTYVPWDYHCPAEGESDFLGAKDLGKFLDMVKARGMHAVLKPGPLITGEWPNGFGTFGAVPRWFKEAHPEALERNAKGRHFSFSPLGFIGGRQPSYLHPTYLAAVDKWYEVFAREVASHIGDTVVGVQIDNETNQYWSERFGEVGYAEPSVAFFRGWLAEQYGDIASLNAAWGTRHRAFDDVSAPGRLPAQLQDNPAARDWYEAGHAYVREYLGRLKSSLQRAGITEDKVAFMTNDAPFGLLFGDKVVKHVLLADAKKHRVAPVGMDLYPKLGPSSSIPQDQPFQADFFTKLQGHRGQATIGDAAYLYGAELQGGLYSVLGGLIKMPVPAMSTDQLLARTVGHGMKGGSMYVIRDGLNADNSRYDYQAALTQDGTPTDRYDVLKEWGGFLQAHGARLLESKEVHNKVAVLVDGAHAAPKGGTLDDPQQLQTIECPALYGWLKASGINAEVLDAQTASAEDLARMKVIFFLNPDHVSAQTKERLKTFTRDGGTLVNLLWDDLDHEGPARDGYGGFGWTGRGAINVRADGFSGAVDARGYETFVSSASLPDNAKPIAWERKWPFGEDGRVVGYTQDEGRGKTIHLGTNVFGLFNRDEYYANNQKGSIEHAIKLARWLNEQGGERPVVSAGRARELVWARRTDDTTYLFAVNDNDAASVMHVSVHDAEALGIQPDVRYRVRDALHGHDYKTVTGAQLRAQGLRVPVARFGTAVVVLEPEAVTEKEDSNA